MQYLVDIVHAAEQAGTQDSPTIWVVLTNVTAAVLVVGHGVYYRDAWDSLSGLQPTAATS
jgi:hypothetical protein